MAKKEQIKKFIEEYKSKKERTIVIVDYGNVEKWKIGLKWKIDIRKLSQLIKNFSIGKKHLRRFYYGTDNGPSEKHKVLTEWSRAVLEKAKMNNYKVVTKDVKYIHDSEKESGFEKKCDLDVEMAVDLVKEKDSYDHIILFSGDGDLMYAIRYLKEKYSKNCIVFSARGHIGREVIDAKKDGVLERIFFAEDFEYRLRTIERRFFKRKKFQFQGTNQKPPLWGGVDQNRVSQYAYIHIVSVLPANVKILTFFCDLWIL